MCLPIITAENWKPATKTDQGMWSTAPPFGTSITETNCFPAVLNSLIALVNDPEPEHPLRADLAEELQKDRKKFFKNAEEYTRKYSEKRPTG